MVLEILDIENELLGLECYMDQVSHGTVIRP